MTDSLHALSTAVLAFRDARDWGQFHTLRNLMAGLSVEAAELQELALWKTDAEIADAMLDSGFRTRVGEELGDVLIYALLLAHRAGMEPAQLVENKLAINAAKYPVALSRGSAKKYTELSDGSTP